MSEKSFSRFDYIFFLSSEGFGFCFAFLCFGWKDIPLCSDLSFYFDFIFWFLAHENLL